MVDELEVAVARMQRAAAEFELAAFLLEHSSLPALPAVHLFAVLASVVRAHRCQVFGNRHFVY